MNKTVLILDDDPMAVELASCALEEAGYNIIQCFEPNAALAAFKKAPIDFALVDLKMPQMNGREVIKNCKKIQKKCSFIVISGFLDIDKYMDLKSLNVVDCFQKPVDMEVIIKAISAPIAK